MNTDINYFFANIRKILRAYTDYQTEALSEFALSPNEIVVLSNIETTKMASEIAIASGVSKALVSRSVKSLKEKGYITSSISTADKREQVLVLTHEGRNIVNIIADVNKKFYEITFKGFDGNEKDVLNALMKLLLKNLAKGDLNENARFEL